MPEYLAPGVYVEEVSFRAKSIEGVSTSTAAFVGPTRYGPVDLEPDVITSLVEFERTYGDRQMLAFAAEKDVTVAADPMDNYMWHAVRAFFEQGGKRVYVQRIFRPLVDEDDPALHDVRADPDGRSNDGRAAANLPATGDPKAALVVKARFPGAAGSRRVRVTLRLGPNALSGTTDAARVAGLRDRDVVYIVPETSPIGSPLTGEFFVAERSVDPVTGAPVWRFKSPHAATLNLGSDFHPAPVGGDQVRLVTVTVTAMPTEPDGLTQVWSDLPLDPAHALAGAPDSLFARFAEKPENLSLARTVPITITGGESVDDGLDVLAACFAARSDLRGNLIQASDPKDPSTDLERSVDLQLNGGNDGRRPLATEYEGTASPTRREKTGLKSIEDIEDVSIIAAPGHTFGYANGYAANAATVMSLLIGHAERMRYRIAVLDSGPEQSVAEVREMRAQFDSKYAAFYYPWVRILDPVTQREIHLPPSGFVAGIYARNDVERAVYKAPANEVVTLAIGFQTLLNKGQQEVLNPEGINCFRFFEGRGYRLWGARTISSDPEWKYVNLRRYFAYLEHSIDRGTQWAVFEPNGEALWANVRRTVEDFLFDQWQKGALLGDKPEKAYFVKCDRSTMTQNDLDNGRLVCLIGVAALRPAEFVIFQIGQWTADRKG
jgi:Bacteriophage tail sheath protein